MTRHANRGMASRRGYFGIGIANPKRSVNMGTLWRSSAAMGADFTFQIGGRFEHQSSDTLNSWKHVPHFVYPDVDHWQAAVPHDCVPVAVELVPDALPLFGYSHPERAVYVLGAEDSGVPVDVMECCRDTVVLPGEFCLNVSVAGSIVMYDRLKKRGRLTAA
jgi:tRNA(Leu) C34 or U34 (ribose-2'-O)-methylase TrmL